MSITVTRIKSMFEFIPFILCLIYGACHGSQLISVDKAPIAGELMMPIDPKFGALTVHKQLDDMFIKLKSWAKESPNATELIQILEYLEDFYAKLVKEKSKGKIWECGGLEDPVHMMCEHIENSLPCSCDPALYRKNKKLQITCDGIDHRYVLRRFNQIHLSFSRIIKVCNCTPDGMVQLVMKRITQDVQLFQCSNRKVITKSKFNEDPSYEVALDVQVCFDYIAHLCKRMELHRPCTCTLIKSTFPPLFSIVCNTLDTTSQLALDHDIDYTRMIYYRTLTRYKAIRKYYMYNVTIMVEKRRKASYVVSYSKTVGETVISQLEDRKFELTTYEKWELEIVPYYAVDYQYNCTTPVTRPQTTQHIFISSSSGSHTESTTLLVTNTASRSTATGMITSISTPHQNASVSENIVTGSEETTSILSSTLTSTITSPESKSPRLSTTASLSTVSGSSESTGPHRSSTSKPSSTISSGVSSSEEITTKRVSGTTMSPLTETPTTFGPNGTVSESSTTEIPGIITSQTSPLLSTSSMISEGLNVTGSMQSTPPIENIETTSREVSLSGITTTTTESGKTTSTSSQETASLAANATHSIPSSTTTVSGSTRQSPTKPISTPTNQNTGTPTEVGLPKRNKTRTPLTSTSKVSPSAPTPTISQETTTQLSGGTSGKSATSSVSEITETVPGRGPTLASNASLSEETESTTPRLGISLSTSSSSSTQTPESNNTGSGKTESTSPQSATTTSEQTGTTVSRLISSTKQGMTSVSPTFNITGSMTTETSISLTPQLNFSLSSITPSVSISEETISLTKPFTPGSLGSASPQLNRTESNVTYSISSETTSTIAGIPSKRTPKQGHITYSYTMSSASPGLNEFSPNMSTTVSLNVSLSEETASPTPSSLVNETTETIFEKIKTKQTPKPGHITYPYSISSASPGLNEISPSQSTTLSSNVSLSGETVSSTPSLGNETSATISAKIPSKKTPKPGHITYSYSISSASPGLNEISPSQSTTLSSNVSLSEETASPTPSLGNETTATIPGEIKTRTTPKGKHITYSYSMSSGSPGLNEISPSMSTTLSSNVSLSEETVSSTPSLGNETSPTISAKIPSKKTPKPGHITYSYSISSASPGLNENSPSLSTTLTNVSLSEETASPTPSLGNETTTTISGEIKTKTTPKPGHITYPYSISTASPGLNEISPSQSTTLSSNVSLSEETASPTPSSMGNETTGTISGKIITKTTPKPGHITYSYSISSASPGLNEISPTQSTRLSSNVSLSEETASPTPSSMGNETTGTVSGKTKTKTTPKPGHITYPYSLSSASPGVNEISPSQSTTLSSNVSLSEETVSPTPSLGNETIATISGKIKTRTTPKGGHITYSYSLSSASPGLNEISPSLSTTLSSNVSLSEETVSSTPSLGNETTATISGKIASKKTPKPGHITYPRTASSASPGLNENSPSVSSSSTIVSTVSQFEETASSTPSFVTNESSVTSFGGTTFKHRHDTYSHTMSSASPGSTFTTTVGANVSVSEVTSSPTTPSSIQTSSPTGTATVTSKRAISSSARIWTGSGSTPTISPTGSISEGVATLNLSKTSERTGTVTGGESPTSSISSLKTETTSATPEGGSSSSSWIGRTSVTPAPNATQTVTEEGPVTTTISLPSGFPGRQKNISDTTTGVVPTTRGRCVTPICINTCLNGFRKDHNKCQTCKCIPPNLCDPTCGLECPLGYKYEKVKKCQVCECLNNQTIVGVCDKKLFKDCKCDMHKLLLENQIQLVCTIVELKIFIVSVNMIIEEVTNIINFHNLNGIWAVSILITNGFSITGRLLVDCESLNPYPLMMNVDATSVLFVPLGRDICEDPIFIMCTKLDSEQPCRCNREGYRPPILSIICTGNNFTRMIIGYYDVRNKILQVFIAKKLLECAITTVQLTFEDKTVEKSTGFIDCDTKKPVKLRAGPSRETIIAFPLRTALCQVNESTLADLCNKHSKDYPCKCVSKLDKVSKMDIQCMGKDTEVIMKSYNNLQKLFRGVVGWDVKFETTVTTVTFPEVTEIIPPMGYCENSTTFQEIVKNDKLALITPIGIDACRRSVRSICELYAYKPPCKCDMKEYEKSKVINFDCKGSNITSILDTYNVAQTELEKVQVSTEYRNVNATTWSIYNTTEIDVEIGYCESLKRVKPIVKSEKVQKWKFPVGAQACATNPKGFCTVFKDRLPCKCDMVNEGGALAPTFTCQGMGLNDLLRDSNTLRMKLNKINGNSNKLTKFVKVVLPDFTALPDIYECKSRVKQYREMEINNIYMSLNASACTKDMLDTGNFYAVESKPVPNRIDFLRAGLVQRKYRVKRAAAPGEESQRLIVKNGGARDGKEVSEGGGQATAVAFGAKEYVVTRSALLIAASALFGLLVLVVASTVLAVLLYVNNKKRGGNGRAPASAIPFYYHPDLEIDMDTLGQLPAGGSPGSRSDSGTKAAAGGGRPGSARKMAAPKTFARSMFGERASNLDAQDPFYGGDLRNGFP